MVGRNEVYLGRLQELLRFCDTDSQRAKIEAIIAAGGNVTEASKELGYGSRNSVRQTLAVLETKASMAGYNPDYDMTHPPAPGFVTKGTSTLYDDLGNQRLQWVKTDRDKETAHKLMLEVVAELCNDIKRVKPLKPPKATRDDLLNQITLTDCHFSMMAWHEEGGEDWDIKIAEKVLSGAFDEAIDRSPNANTCVIYQGGDWLHSDGLLPVTPTSNHVLDTDSRFSKAVRQSIRLFRRIIDKALKTHQTVHVIMAEGNHDIASSIWLREMFSALYENEPRVTVETSPLPFYVYEWGNTALFYHHGHLVKFAGLGSLFAAEFPEVWGRTKFRYGHCGHMHHKAVKEDRGIEVTQHPTIAARDAYSARGGYHSMRRILGITYDKRFGEVGSVCVTPEMLVQNG